MRVKQRDLLLSASAIAVGMSLVAVDARAADQGAASASGATGQLSEIIVTATRREQSLQKVPVAVTAITAEQITKTGATDLEDLQFSIPNFAFAGGPSIRRPDIALRGISSATRVPGFEGSIGFFVDGVYQPFPDQWNNPVLDIDRLEVLYGPQDTLFGKNTIAGAISITTRKPSNTLDGDLSAEYGNYNYYSIRGDADIPIIQDKLSARVSGFDSSRDGYITNIYNGQKYNDIHQQGGRFQLRFTPTAQYEANLAIDVYHDEASFVQTQTIGGLYSTGNPREVDINTKPYAKRTNYDVTLSQQYGFDNGAKLTSITAWSQTRAHFHTDEDGNPVDHWVTDILDRTTDFSQEFRFTSPTGQKLDYIAGLYYLYTDWAQPGSLQTLADDPNNARGGLGVLNPDGSVSYADQYAKRVNGNSFAFYASGNYHFTDQLSVSGGLRATHDEKYLAYPGQLTFGAGFLNLCKLGASFGAGCLIPGGTYPVEPPYQSSLSNTAVTGSGSLNYQITKDVLVYAKISNGYKAGGWNTDITHSSPPTEFQPEHVTYYEIGEKGEFLDRHLRVNADIFNEDYQNKQETVFINITQGFEISNAASATIKGAEVTMTGVLGDFSANAGIGYSDPTYNNFQCTATINCRGQQLVFSTKTTASLSLDYAHNLENIGKIALDLQATYRDRMFLTVPNDTAETASAVTLVNGRASITVDSGKADLYVFVKNLANITYRVSQFTGSPSYPGYGETSAVLYGEPRFFGVGAKYHF